MGFSYTIPTAGQATTIVTGGTAVTVFAAGTIATFADIQNPSTATESLFVDPTGIPAVAGASTAYELQPGQSVRISTPVSTTVSAVAATSGHKFIAVRY